MCGPKGQPVRVAIYRHRRTYMLEDLQRGWGSVGEEIVGKAWEGPS